MLKLGSFHYTSRGFDLLASLRICNLLIIWKYIMKQLAFLIIHLLHLWKILHEFQATLFGWISLFSFSPPNIYLIPIRLNIEWKYHLHTCKTWNMHSLGHAFHIGHSCVSMVRNFTSMSVMSCMSCDDDMMPDRQRHTGGGGGGVNSTIYLGVDWHSQLLGQ